MKTKYFYILGLVIFLFGVYRFINKNNVNNLPQDLVVSNTSQTSTTDQNNLPNVFSGKIIAGKGTPYLEFIQEDYEKALSSGKVIFLDFYANWCPVCRGEAPEIESGFDSLDTDSVVGFRVNYNDSDTDENEKKLAKQFSVTYQHTKVIVKDGQVVLKDGEVWDSERLLEEINKHL